MCWVSNAGLCRKTCKVTWVFWSLLDLTVPLIPPPKVLCQGRISPQCFTDVTKRIHDWDMHRTVVLTPPIKIAFLYLYTVYYSTLCLYTLVWCKWMLFYIMDAILLISTLHIQYIIYTWYRHGLTHDWRFLETIERIQLTAAEILPFESTMDSTHQPFWPFWFVFAISLFETIHTCPQVLLLWKPCISWQHPFHTRAKCHVSQCCIAASLRKACSGLIIFEILLTCTDLYWLTAKTLPLSADVMTLSQAPNKIILFSQCPYNSCSHIVATYSLILPGRFQHV